MALKHIVYTSTHCFHCFDVKASSMAGNIYFPDEQQSKFSLEGGEYHKGEVFLYLTAQGSVLDRYTPTMFHSVGLTYTDRISS